MGCAGSNASGASNADTEVILARYRKQKIALNASRAGRLQSQFELNAVHNDDEGGGQEEVCDGEGRNRRRGDQYHHDGDDEAAEESQEGDCLSEDDLAAFCSGREASPLGAVVVASPLGSPRSSKPSPFSRPLALNAFRVAKLAICEERTRRAAGIEDWIDALPPPSNDDDSSIGFVRGALESPPPSQSGPILSLDGEGSEVVWAGGHSTDTCEHVLTSIDQNHHTPPLFPASAATSNLVVLSPANLSRPSPPLVGDNDQYRNHQAALARADSNPLLMGSSSERATSTANTSTVPPNFVSSSEGDDDENYDEDDDRSANRNDSMSSWPRLAAESNPHDHATTPPLSLAFTPNSTPPCTRRASAASSARSSARFSSNPPAPGPARLNSGALARLQSILNAQN